MSSAIESTILTEAEAYKASGNCKHYNANNLLKAHFKLDHYKEAIADYTKAIIRNKSAAYFTNRALCYLKLEDFPKVIQDCESAIEIDSVNIKAYSYMGQALMHNETRLQESVSALTKAYNLAVTQKSPLSTEINQHYRNAKRLLWSVDEELRRQNESRLYKQLSLCVTGFNAQKTSMYEDLKKRGMRYEEKIKENEIKDINDVMGYVDRVLEKDNTGRKRTIPEYFLGKITLEIMTDPVITPCGITYDRVEILQHLSRIGKFDPITRRYMSEEMLIPNLALKECIDEYLKHNGWALDY